LFYCKKNTELLNISDINSIVDLKKYPLILPIPNTANRNDLDILLQKNNVELKNVINIHTSEMIISAVKKDLGIGYVIHNLVENEIKNNEIEVLNIKEKLPTVGINIIYDNRFLTKAPTKFIEDYIDYNLDL
jgi:DNA-binding transcriptional LysR family regulator